MKSFVQFLNMQVRNNIAEQFKKSSAQKQSKIGEQPRSNKRPSNMEMNFERLTTELKHHIDQHMAIIPKLCAEVRRSIFYVHDHVGTI